MDGERRLGDARRVGEVTDATEDVGELNESDVFRFVGAVVKRATQALDRVIRIADDAKEESGEIEEHPKIALIVSLRKEKILI